MRESGVRTRVILWMLIFVSSVMAVLPMPNAYAAVTARSLTLQPNGTNGASAPGVAANDLFSFTLPTNTIGSILFQYCVQSQGTCTNATLATGSGGLAMSTTGITATGLTGAVSSGWTLNNSTNGTPYLKRASAGSTSGAASVTLVGVVNPSAANQSFYVRIQTYLSTDTTGTPIDTGSVAGSTTNPIVLSGVMPESLTFCTGATVPNVGGAGTAPNCSAATSGNINFTNLFSAAATDTATSQMAATTNAGSGYVITYQGDTMKNGSFAITAANAGSGTAVAPTIGQSQFGMNLVANTTPAVGTALYNPGLTGNVYNGAVAANYNTANMFAFVPNVATTVANSASSVTDLETYTVSYIVNVPGSQPAGTYTTTLTYVCTATF